MNEIAILMYHYIDNFIVNKKFQQKNLLKFIFGSFKHLENFV